MDYHALEAMQCMVGGRKGGETGVKQSATRCGRRGLARPGVKGAGPASCSKPLVAIGFAQGLTVTMAPREPGRKRRAATAARHRRRISSTTPTENCATLLMLDGVVADYTFAARLAWLQHDESTQFLLPPTRMLLTLAA